MTPCIDTLYVSSPAELLRMRILIRVKLFEKSTERMYKEKLVTGLLPLKEGVQLRTTQRAPTSRVTTLIGEYGRTGWEKILIILTTSPLIRGGEYRDNKVHV